MKLKRVLVWLLACGLAAMASAASFVPPAGKTLLVIGQELGAVADYRKVFGEPGGFMLYTDLLGQKGLRGRYQGPPGSCNDSGVHDLQTSLRDMPGAVVQLGLWMVPQINDAAQGRMDNQIARLAETLRKVGRPIYLRPGYEFDGPWNHYDPQDYQKAFRRMVDIFHGKDVDGTKIAPVDNVAFVWHSAAWRTDGGQDIDAWYPGDDYVDWVAVSWFSWSCSSDENAGATAREKVAAFAKAHHKPLMIAESSTKEHFAPALEKSWSGWFVPVQTWIEKNDVRVWSYINQDWEAQAMWSGSCGNGDDWGDTRVERPDSTVRAAWGEMLKTPRFSFRW